MLPRHDMTLCPFCKSAKIDDHAPCPRCGRSARAAPAKVEADGWGDEDELSRGGQHASSGGPSAYGGGAVGFGDDDPFADDAPAASLELDLPASPRPLPVQSTTPSRSPSASNIEARLAAESGAFGAALSAPPSGAHPAAAPSRAPSSPSLDPRRTPEGASSAGAPASSRGQDAAALIARFPVAPVKLWEMPMYALKVLYRQFELRQDLTSLRRRRSPDVPLYERALRTYDAKTFVIGLALAGAALGLACFLFFLPVFLRFWRAD
jgi:hypothetical protein